MRHFVLNRKTALVIQAFLFWFAASSDGLSGYQTSDKKLLLVLKCPHTKRNMSPIKLVQGTNFYMNLKNGKAVLKKIHSSGYYLQMQLAIGLSGFHKCGYVSYTFKALIIVGNKFGVSYFGSLIQKLNSIYKKIILPFIIDFLLFWSSKNLIFS